MFRTIITPKETTLTIELPDQMVGKSVEVIAFEIEKKGETVVKPEDLAESKPKRTFEEAVAFWDFHAVDFANLRNGNAKICMSDLFVDANICVYAFDRGEPIKQTKARELLSQYSCISS